MGQLSMGQRLVINITANDTVLANAYFHWDGYTQCAIEHTCKLIALQEWLEKLEEYGQVTLDKRAIFMLEFLGAGITPEDFHLKTYPDIWTPAKDRNEGLIQVSKEQIKDAENWAEGLVAIDIFNKTVDFDVFFYYDEGDLDEEEEKNPVDMPMPWNMSYSEFLKFADWSHHHTPGQLYWNSEQLCKFIE